MRQQNFRTWGIIAAAVALAALAGACNGDSGTEPLAIFVTVTADPASISLTGSSTITAQVRTENGNAGAGWRLEWGSTLGNIFVSGGAGSTDGNGRASAVLRGEGVAGVAVVTVRAVNRTEQGQVLVPIGQ
jgi:hypothetical protein